jgi:hypothetical protein
MTDAEAIASLQSWLSTADPNTTTPSYAAVDHAVTRLNALIALNNEIYHALFTMGVVENQGTWKCVHPDTTEEAFATLTTAALHWWEEFSANYPT